MSSFADPKRVYVVTQFGFGLASALAWTLMGLYYVQNAGLEPFQLLLVGAVLEAACFLLEIPTGVIADVYSRRLSVILACLFLGMGMLMVAAFPQFWLLLAAMVVCAVGYTCLSGAFQAWLADEIGETKAGRAYLVGSQWNRLGGIIGILSTAALATFSLPLPIFLGGTVMLLLAVYLRLFMPENGFKSLSPAERQTWSALTDTLKHGFSEVRRSRVLTLLMVMSLLFGASGEVIERLKDFHLLKGMGVPASITPAYLFAGLALITYVLGFGLTTVLIRILHADEFGRAVKVLQGVIVFSTALMVLFAYAPTFWLAATALMLYSVASSLYGPLYNVWLNQGLDSRSRATVNSIASQADALGQMAVGPIFGALGNILGVPVALTLAALIRLPMLPLVSSARKREAEKS